MMKKCAAMWLRPPMWRPPCLVKAMVFLLALTPVGSALSQGAAFNVRFVIRDDEKAHDAVARRTFPSQNGKSTTCSDHFWMFNRTTLDNDDNDDYDNYNDYDDYDDYDNYDDYD